MGWFSDALFGKKKRLEQSKIDDYMSPSRNMFNKQMNMAEDMMDPNSTLNLQQEQRVRGNYYDAAQANNQSLMSMAAMRGVSPGQAGQMAKAGFATSLGGFGNTLADMTQNNYNQGANMFGNLYGEQKSMDEQQANTYIQQINAHNQSRNQNMSFAQDIAGGLLGKWNPFSQGGQGNQVDDEMYAWMQSQMSGGDGSGGTL